MADDIAVTPGSGATIGADEIASVKYQRIKVIHGADGVNDGDVSRANGLPAADCRIAAQEDLVTIAFGSITGSFASCALVNIATSTTIWIYNTCDTAMLFNWTGANAKMIVPANCARIVPILEGATQLQIKYASAPASGNVYFEVRK